MYLVKSVYLIFKYLINTDTYFSNLVLMMCLQSGIQSAGLSWDFSATQ